MPSPPYKNFIQNHQWVQKVAPISEVYTSAIFEWVKLRGLKMWRRGHWRHLPIKFHENPPISSNVITGGNTHR
jgi:hypothetical protein